MADPAPTVPPPFALAALAPDAPLFLILRETYAGDLGGDGRTAGEIAMGHAFGPAGSGLAGLRLLPIDDGAAAVRWETVEERFVWARRTSAQVGR